MSAYNIVHLPDAADVEQAKVSSRTLARYANKNPVQLAIKASNRESDDLVLPGPVLQILLQVLTEMSKGNAIRLVPHLQELTTQDAANLLNVSRPHLVKLLESGKIPFHKVGAHRRVNLTDVLDYKQRTDLAREQTLDALTALSQEEGMGY